MTKRMKWMLWILTGVSITGTILNIYKMPVAFLCWTITNFCWMVHNYRIRQIQAACLFGIYWILAIIGFVAWSVK